MAVAFPGESAEYRAARNRLLDQEIELRRAMEAVADARRRLPPGGVVPEDYVFQAHGPDGTPARVRLSELFAPGKNSLVIYSMMFPRAADDTSPGPPAGRTALLPLGSELFYAPVDPGQEPRHVGTIEPLWNLFDFTREGRPASWHEQFSY
jgi:predicted dithiol-disulfide oxidoreductase (DUF899 family)